MLAGYGRYVNDNVRTGHLKCRNCKTRTDLTKIERDDNGCEVRSFACRHCNAVTSLRLPIGGEEAQDRQLRDLDGR